MLGLIVLMESHFGLMMYLIWVLMMDSLVVLILLNMWFHL